MATIENRGPLQWRALVRRKGFPTYSRTFERQRDAQAWATELEAAIGRGLHADIRRLTDKRDGDLRTIADLVDRFLTDVVCQPGRRVGQVASEKPRLARIKSTLGHITIEMLSAQDVARWRDQRLREGAAAQTVRHDLNTLSVVLRTAISEWSVEALRNVVRDITKPSLPPGRSRRVSEAEISALLHSGTRVLNSVQSLRYSQSQFKLSEELPDFDSEVDFKNFQANLKDPDTPWDQNNRYFSAIIILAIETSMRLGELISLNWKNIDLENQTAHLPKTKNGEVRTVALSTTAVVALKRTRGGLILADDRVFPWARSDSFVGRFARRVRATRKAYEERCAATGEAPDPKFLTNLRFHDLRHEATSRLFEKGLNVMEVSSMTGHKSMQMLKRYTHIEATKLVSKLG